MEEAGEFSGLSIFLWEQLSERLGVDYKIEKYSLEDLLDIVVTGKADFGVSCLSVNSDREKRMDFSHSYYETRLAIAIKQSSYMIRIYNFLFSSNLLIALGVISGIALFIGGIFSMLEQKINPKLFSMKSRLGKVLEAFTIGLLFVVSGPIRYYEFKTSTARLLSAVLAIASTLMIASLTAILASAFTLDHLRSEIRGPQNLRDTRVGVLGSSTSAAYLEDNGISYVAFHDLKEIIVSLDAGKLDAVVADATFLKYEIRQAKINGEFESLLVLPYEFNKQFYAIALPEGSPHMETLNQALLSVRGSPQWKQQIKFYLNE